MGANLLEATASKDFCERVLDRVEMWCTRQWVESQDAAHLAMASQDAKEYIFWRTEQSDWLGALRVVVVARIGFSERIGR